mmetsp:Transcript_7213/g.18632  ORF Transcript_7213/g.18632 Transcript_7213/m.18632 type:complete len:214 (-) Transcript_7213:229-870(-)
MAGVVHLHQGSVSRQMAGLRHGGCVDPEPLPLTGLVVRHKGVGRLAAADHAGHSHIAGRLCCLGAPTPRLRHPPAVHQDALVPLRRVERRDDHIAWRRGTHLALHARPHVQARLVLERARRAHWQVLCRPDVQAKQVHWRLRQHSLPLLYQLSLPLPPLQLPHTQVARNRRRKQQQRSLPVHTAGRLTAARITAPVDRRRGGGCQGPAAQRLW